MKTYKNERNKMCLTKKLIKENVKSSFQYERVIISATSSQYFSKYHSSFNSQTLITRSSSQGLAQVESNPLT